MNDDPCPLATAIEQYLQIWNSRRQVANRPVDRRRKRPLPKVELERVKCEPAAAAGRSQ